MLAATTSLRRLAINGVLIELRFMVCALVGWQAVNKVCPCLIYAGEGKADAARANNFSIKIACRLIP
ncbi:hypothetical protein B195_001925 [Pseudomonas sp. Lz4W]|nr:hypothetical protein AV641_01920 [Pseudomonas fragi]AUB73638.1 hypothetical protein B195_001925 [Pseudomonas sp. Lz4W]